MKRQIRSVMFTVRWRKHLLSHSPLSPTELESGASLEDYLVCEETPGGCFKALHMLTGQWVTIQRYNSCKGLGRYCSMYAKFYNNNILRLYETVPRVSDEIWLVFDPIVNSLDNIYRTGFRYKYGECRLVIRQVVDALEHIHRQGYAHGNVDMKHILLQETPTSIKLCGLENCVRVSHSSLNSRKMKDLKDLALLTYSLVTGVVDTEVLPVLTEEDMIVLPKDCQDLVMGILRRKKGDNHNMAELLYHPWIATSSSKLTELTSNQKPVNLTIVQHMVVVTGISESVILSKVIRHKADPLFAAYELLLRRWKGGQSLPYSWCIDNRGINQLKKRIAQRLPLQLNSLMGRQKRGKVLERKTYRLPTITSSKDGLVVTDSTEKFRGLLKSLKDKTDNSRQTVEQTGGTVDQMVLPRVTLVQPQNKISDTQKSTCLKLVLSRERLSIITKNCRREKKFKRLVQRVMKRFSKSPPRPIQPPNSAAVHRSRPMQVCKTAAQLTNCVSPVDKPPAIRPNTPPVRKIVKQPITLQADNLLFKARTSKVLPLTTEANSGKTTADVTGTADGQNAVGSFSTDIHVEVTEKKQDSKIGSAIIKDDIEKSARLNKTVKVAQVQIACPTRTIFTEGGLKGTQYKRCKQQRNKLEELKLKQHASIHLDFGELVTQWKILPNLTQS